jgi:hypothetical protein
MQAFMGKLHTNAQTRTTRESLLSNFSSKQTLRRKVHPTLIIQELQAIKYIKQHNISYQ